MPLNKKDKLELLLAAFALFLSITSLAASVTTYIRAEQIAAKPVVVFDFRSSDGWYARNIGNGPALNLVFVDTMIAHDGWCEPISHSGLAQGDELKLHWQQLVLTPEFAVSYSDYLGNRSTTKLSEGFHTFVEKDELSMFRVEEIEPYTDVHQHLHHTEGTICKKGKG